MASKILGVTPPWLTYLTAAVLSFIGALLLVVLIAGSFDAAEAHSEGNYYGSNDWDVDPRIRRGANLNGSGLETAAALDRFRDSNNAINAISGSTFDILDSSVIDSSVGWPGACFDPPTQNRIYLTAVSFMNYYGVTKRCTDGMGNYDMVVIRFDRSDRTWYTGTWLPPGGQTSLAGVATHEYVHASGWGAAPGNNHFFGSVLCPSTNKKHTMCATWSEAETPNAQTLETHDVDTIQDRF